MGLVAWLPGAQFAFLAGPGATGRASYRVDLFQRKKPGCHAGIMPLIAELKMAKIAHDPSLLLNLDCPWLGDGLAVPRNERLRGSSDDSRIGECTVLDCF